MKLRSLEEIFQAEQGRLLRYFRRRVGGDEAPDLVQEALARLVGSAMLDRLDNPATYLNRIARNMLIDRMRQRQRKGAIFYPLDEDRDAPVRAEQAWRIEARDLLCLYRQAVRAMPPNRTHFNTSGKLLAATRQTALSSWLTEQLSGRFERRLLPVYAETADA